MIFSLEKHDRRLTNSGLPPTGGFSVFAGVGERTREGNDLYREMQESVSALRRPLPSRPAPLIMSAIRMQGVIKMGDKRGESKVTLVYGQMNEPPGARARVALTGERSFRGRCPALHPKHRPAIIPPQMPPGRALGHTRHYCPSCGICRHECVVLASLLDSPSTPLPSQA